MRPHKIFNCVLYILLTGILLHIFVFLVIPLLSFDNNSDSDSLNVNRDVKDLKVDHFSMKESLLSKLRFHVYELIKFNPNPHKGPVPLVRRHKSLITDFINATGTTHLEFNQQFNQSLFGYQPDQLNSSDLFQLMLQINDAQQIVNIDKFPNPEFVIVIQIHNRLEYLTILIESLLNVKDIHRTLLIFSHDVYIRDFNYLIRNIRFAPVLQLFFPFNQQVFRREYPGYSAKDCDVHIKKPEGFAQKCFNHNWSDSYQHYRDYKYTQTKHHWAWKTNYVFERVRALKNFHNPVIFMEEDHYLVEDFLHMLRLMWSQKQKSHPEVSILCMGTYEKGTAFNPSSKYQIGPWVSSFHNMGMVFNKTIWNRMKSCSKNFCEFDDYNWDWSLQHVNKKCLLDGFQVMLLKFAPRIFHIGECGIHHKTKVCNPYIKLYKIRQMLIQNMQYLYPATLLSIGTTNVRSKVMKPNGGWSDYRDKRLCIHLMNGSSYLENVTSIYQRLTHKSAFSTSSSSSSVSSDELDYPKTFSLTILEELILMSN